MRATLVLLIATFVLTVAVGDLASRHLGASMPYLPNASGQEGGLLNDAGTGGDAGDTKDTASPLMTFGHFAAGFMGTDSDWYRYPPMVLPDPGCVQLSGSGDRVNDFLLEGGSGEAAGAVYSTRTTTELAIALPVFGTTYLGFDTITPHTGVQSVYEFVSAFTPPTTVGGDAGSGQDAGGGLSGALSITDPCVTGNIASTSDKFDVYKFEAAAGDRFVISLGAAAAHDLRFGIFSSNENILQVGRSGDTLAHEMQRAGTVYVGVWQGPGSQSSWPETMSLDGDAGIVLEPATAETGRPYVIGMCKPYCLVL